MYMALKRKKESKWLIVENRKVHCYLCGRKMLKASQRIYDAESGHYSHVICEKEKQLTGTNERRSAVKKIVAGAGVLGLTAVGVDKFTSFGRMSNSVFSSNAKDQTANPDLETVITSQGIILPSLTSDPANPVAGQMWYRSDAGVTAHYDSIQNRVVYSSEINNGNVNVTSKGIINGLSVLPNDGTGGFGPDTTLGATSVGEIGSPYTQASGIQEAWNYAFSKILSIGFGGQPAIHFSEGTFYLNEDVTIAGTSTVKPNVVITGSGKKNTWIFINNTNGNGIVFDPATVGDIYISNLSIHAPVAVNTMLNYYSSTNSGNEIVLSNIYVTAADTVTTASLYIWNTGALIIYDVENNSTMNMITAKCNPLFAFINSTGEGNINVQGDTLTAYIENVYWSTSSNSNNLWQFGGTNTNGAVVVIDKCNIPPVIDVNGNLEILKVTGCDNQSGMPNGEQFQSTATSAVIKHFVFKDNFYVGITTANNLLSTALTTDWADVNSIMYDSTSTKTLALPINAPTLSTNPPASGTVYQNTNPYAIEIDLPVYATTSGTAGYVTIAKGSTDTPTAISSQYVSGDTSSTSTQIIRLRVPAGWYYEFTGSGVTFATATPFAE
jgi:hypothetical protein